jgi:SnoaL-like domain
MFWMPLWNSLPRTVRWIYPVDHRHGVLDWKEKNRFAPAAPAASPDVYYSNDRHWVCGKMGFSEWTLMGTTPSGEQVEVFGTDHLEFREGKIIRKNSFWKIVEQ